MATCSPYVEVTSHVTSTIPYGAYIPEKGLLTDVMLYLGLGYPGELPVKAYGHVDNDFLARMFGLRLVGFPLDVCERYQVTKQAANPLIFDIHAEALQAVGAVNEIDPASNGIDIYYCAHTGVPLFGNFYVNGDGIEVYYTFRHKAPVNR